MQKIPITLEALLVIDAIDRRKSFAKAAEELNKATSALSYIVQKLEENLGITLFERQGRRSVLTPAGLVVLEEGRKILQASALLVDKAKETSTGWETHLTIALESTLDNQVFYKVLSDFLLEHPSVEIDLKECVLSGGWEALEHNQVDLVVGAPGPTPTLKGFRSVSLGTIAMTPVIGPSHKYANLANNASALERVMNDIRRVVIHDTSQLNVTRSAGFVDGCHIIYVENMAQKISALKSGIGRGHLPTLQAQDYIANGELIKLNLPPTPDLENFIVWKISNKGKALRVLTQMLEQATWL